MEGSIEIENAVALAPDGIFLCEKATAGALVEEGAEKNLDSKTWRISIDEGY